MENAVEKTIANQDWIDKAADPVHRTVASILEKAPLLASVLHGDIIGHPLHAVMVTLPIGAWSVGALMDVLDLTGTKKLRRAADLTTAVGLAGALSAALPGLADWSTTEGNAKRVGFIHASTNIVVSGLYGASLFARASKKRGLGIALSLVGLGLVGFSGWLGGELAYKYGVGVRSDAAKHSRSSRRSIDPIEEEPVVTVSTKRPYARA